MPARDLLRDLPAVLRARGCYLSLEGGKRLIDLWLMGGRLILGHKAPGHLRELKNASERGLFPPFPHPLERRFIKALKTFFPGRSFRLYPDYSSLCRVLEAAGCGIYSGINGAAFGDPAFPVRESRDCRESRESRESEERKPSLWRPFLEMPGSPVIVPVLPCPLGPEVLVLEATLDFPPGELIPPALLAPAARALYDLAARIKAGTNLGPRYPRIDKALLSSARGIWNRKGIYLTSMYDGEQYVTLWRRFLEGGFLLPPSPREPLILPPALTDGEEKRLAELMREDSRE